MKNNSSRTPAEFAGTILSLIAAAIILLDILGVIGGYPIVSVSTFLLVVLLLLELGVLVGVDIQRNGRFDVFSPSVLFSASITIGYLLPLPAFACGRDLFSVFYPFPFHSREAATNGALFQVIIGVGGFMLTYFLMNRIRSRRAVEKQWMPSPLKYGSLLYILAGIALFAVGVILMGGPSAFIAGLHDRTRAMAGLNYFMEGINLLGVVAVVWWGQTLKSSQKFSMAQRVFTCLALACTALLGSKIMTLVFILILIMLYHYRRRRIALAKMLIFTLTSTLVFGIYDIYLREYLVLGTIVSLDPSASLAVKAQTLVDHMVSLNFPELQTMAVATQAAPDILPWQFGSTYLALAAAPIPRSIWPGKFPPSTEIFTLHLWPNSWLVGGTTIPPGLLGEAYMNFGTAGVFCIMALAGWLYGYLYLPVRSGDGSMDEYISYAVFAALIIHYVRGESYGPTVLLLIILLPMRSLLYFARPRVATQADEA